MFSMKYMQSCSSVSAEIIWSLSADQSSEHTMRVTAAACGKGNSLLAIVIAILVLALVTLYFHAENHLLSTYGKADKVT